MGFHDHHLNANQPSDSGTATRPHVSVLCVMYLVSWVRMYRRMFCSILVLPSLVCQMLLPGNSGFEARADGDWVDV
jgi:hypothetical protein